MQPSEKHTKMSGKDRPKSFTQEERKSITNRYRGLLRSCRRCISKEDMKNIRSAFNHALLTHDGKRRYSGEPYIFHPLNVSRIVVEEIGLGATSIIASLLHETAKDSGLSLNDIEKIYGRQVRTIVDGLTRISGITTRVPSLQAENFRKLLLSFSSDVRVILIKLADRLENMRHLAGAPASKQVQTAWETFYLYAPLAHRMGLYSIKTELEDLSMKYTNSEAYNSIYEKLRHTTAVRNRFIRQFTEPVKKELEKQGFDFEIKARTKSIYSIWTKMKKQNAEFEEVYDIFAVRIILNSKLKNEKSDCWRVYSIVTDFYQPNPNRLRDWISVPKSNGYESLHTTVVGPGGKFVEVQIRTRRMDETAEKGLAAHWRYKGGAGEKNIDEWLAGVREILEDPAINARDLMENFKLNLYSNEVFVFTPQGDLKRFPAGATVLDFAFDIHTDLGSKCVGARINRQNASIKQALRNGDQVSVITMKNQKPKLDWLNYVVTSKAKNKIRQSLREEKQKDADAGKELLMRRLKNWKIEMTDKLINRLLKYYKTKTSVDFYYLIGAGRIEPSDIKELIYEWDRDERNQLTAKEPAEQVDGMESKNHITEDVLVIDGAIDNVDYKLAKCCNPVFGDDIFGFVSVSEGIKIHRISCPNAPQMFSRYNYRIIGARWTGSSQNTAFQVVIRITGVDGVGIVNRISDVISRDMKINMRSINIDSNDGMFEGLVKVLVPGKPRLDMLMARLSKIDGVLKVTRYDEQLEQQ